MNTQAAQHAEQQAPQHGAQQAAPSKSVLAEKRALLRVTARAYTRVFGTGRDDRGTGRNGASYCASPKISTRKRGKKTRRASSRKSSVEHSGLLNLQAENLPAQRMPTISLHSWLEDHR